MNAREGYIIGAFAAGGKLSKGAFFEHRRKCQMFVRSKSTRLGSTSVYRYWRAVGIAGADGDFSSRVEGRHRLDDPGHVCGWF